MFDFNTSEAPKKLNRDFILSKIPDHQLFSYYHGHFNLKDVYKSKFRKDSTPSCGFYISSSGKLIYNDLAKNEKLDIFAFVQKLYNCSFSDAIKRIAADFGLIQGSKASPLVQKAIKDIANFDRTYKKDTKIHFVPMKWTLEAKEFWKSFHITKEELEREGVYQIKTLYINENFIPNVNNVLRFALTVPVKDEIRTKVYSPGGIDTLKWVSNIDLDNPFGINILKKQGSFSVTTKSVKDMIILKKFIPSVIASQNESTAAMSEKTIKKLQFYFPENYIAWDCDDTGNAAMDEMEKLGFKTIRIPSEYYELQGLKDWSDIAKQLGLNAVEQLLKQNNVI